MLPWFHQIICYGYDTPLVFETVDNIKLLFYFICSTFRTRIYFVILSLTGDECTLVTLTIYQNMSFIDSTVGVEANGLLTLYCVFHKCVSSFRMLITA